MHPELKVFWLKDGRADESSRRRQQEQHLRLICWNVEGKRRLDDSPLPNEWAALLLQESSLYFEAAPHAWNTCLSHNQHTQAAVVVHHRLAPDITAWGGDVFPWIYFSRWALALSSLYLPNIDRTDTEWDDSIIHFHDVIGQMRASTCRVCFGGDLNASSLATLVGASHWGGGAQQATLETSFAERLRDLSIAVLIWKTYSQQSNWSCCRRRAGLCLLSYHTIEIRRRETAGPHLGNFQYGTDPHPLRARSRGPT